MDFDAASMPNKNQIQDEMKPGTKFRVVVLSHPLLPITSVLYLRTIP